MKRTTSLLDEYIDFEELYPQVQPSFPTKHSALWFLRRHRGCLVDSGALIILAGRMRFHPERFKQAAVEIGKRQAAA